MKDYIVKLLVPYITRKRNELKVSSDHRVLVILYDKFKGQCTSAVLELLEKNNIDIVFLPANCSDRSQPLDISVNKAANAWPFLKMVCWTDRTASAWEREEACWFEIKPLSVKWFVQLSDYLKSKQDIIKNGFKGAGVTADYLAME